ncbi:uncharacterized protein [Aegilops tauschii subsp. strangulata]|uniref:uncharacterized protein n=1 Tax=Aegilops tauschii subsp. strangulata TaxID=200361 RepID=UPI001E1CA41C|nr:uncharacterized protein LOC120965302 [Aegilops tauschii subsp. strangulata]
MRREIPFVGKASLCCICSFSRARPSRYSTLTEYLLQSAEEQNCSDQQQHSTVTWISGRGASAARAEEQQQHGQSSTSGRGEAAARAHEQRRRSSTAGVGSGGWGCRECEELVRDASRETRGGARRSGRLGGAAAGGQRGSDAGGRRRRGAGGWRHRWAPAVCTAAADGRLVQPWSKEEEAEVRGD